MSETIDITDLVEKMRETFVLAEVNSVFAYLTAIPGLQWLSLPIIAPLTRAAISWLFTFVSKRLVMQAFFTNTALRKASQARDYLEVVHEKARLSPTLSDEEYRKYELAEIAAFNDFVRVNR